jgi:hypothetical protein
MRVRHVVLVWALIVLGLALACAGCAAPPAQPAPAPVAPAPLIVPFVPAPVPVAPAPVIVPVRPVLPWWPWWRPHCPPHRPCPRAEGGIRPWFPGKILSRVIRYPFRPAPPKNPIRPDLWPRG